MKNAATRGRAFPCDAAAFFQAVHAISIRCGVPVGRPAQERIASHRNVLFLRLVFEAHTYFHRK